jgi:hypothetical protein
LLRIASASLVPDRRDQRASGGGFGVVKDFNPFVDLSFELIFVDEAVDLHGAEKVADAFPFRNSESDGRVTPYGT